MIGFPAGAYVWIVAGVTDLRRGFTGLSAIVQTGLAQDPFAGHIFVFRGRRGDLIKLLWWDGDGMCLFAKRLERGRFIWPQAAKARFRSLAHNFRCCWRALTGGGRRGRRRHKWRSERKQRKSAEMFNVLLEYRALSRIIPMWPPPISILRISRDSTPTRCAP
jgi:transposase